MPSLCWPWIPATRNRHCISDPIELEQIRSMTGWETTEWQQQSYDGDTGMCILKCCVSWSNPIPSVPVIDHPIAYRCGCGGGFLVYVSCRWICVVVDGEGQRPWGHNVHRPDLYHKGHIAKWSVMWRIESIFREIDQWQINCMSLDQEQCIIVSVTLWVWVQDQRCRLEWRLILFDTKLRNKSDSNLDASTDRSPHQVSGI